MFIIWLSYLPNMVLYVAHKHVVALVLWIEPYFQYFGINWKFSALLFPGFGWVVIKLFSLKFSDPHRCRVTWSWTLLSSCNDQERVPGNFTFFSLDPDLAGLQSRFYFGFKSCTKLIWGFLRHFLYVQIPILPWFGSHPHAIQWGSENQPFKIWKHTKSTWYGSSYADLCRLIITANSSK